MVEQTNDVVATYSGHRYVNSRVFLCKQILLSLVPAIFVNMFSFVVVYMSEDCALLEENV